MPSYICACGHEDDEQGRCPYCDDTLTAKVEKPEAAKKSTTKKKRAATKVKK
jgi:hypothetical protein